jgi:hypothetical protein
MMSQAMVIIWIDTTVKILGINQLSNLVAFSRTGNPVATVGIFATSRYHQRREALVALQLGAFPRTCTSLGRQA